LIVKATWWVKGMTIVELLSSTSFIVKRFNRKHSMGKKWQQNKEVSWKELNGR